MQVKISPSWQKLLEEEFQKDYFKDLISFVKEEYKNATVYPPGSLIFNAFNQTSFEEIKVVIIGQDPYHGKGQAMGLSFSVPDGINPPPSLKNIFKEIFYDLGIPIPTSGNLERWSKQGVFLLNAVLTVRAGQPGSHRGKGWETFTNAVIQLISAKKENVVFLLWGAYAKEKEELIDKSKHLVLTAAHPSPYSANNGFFGCHHFGKANEYLYEKGKSIIEW
jgi:uracil-DNA glycosylase